MYSIALGFSDNWKVKLLGSYRDDDLKAAFWETILSFREWQRLSQSETLLQYHTTFPTTSITFTDACTICICKEEHLFAECLYLIPSKRPVGWKHRPEILTQIKDKLSRTEWGSRKILIQHLQREDKAALERLSPLKNDDLMPDSA